MSCFSFISADQKELIVVFGFVCVLKGQNKCFKNTRVSVLLSCSDTLLKCCQLWRTSGDQFPEIAIMIAVVAVVFRGSKEHATDTQKSRGLDESCRGLSFIVTKPR